MRKLIVAATAVMMIGTLCGLGLITAPRAAAESVRTAPHCIKALKYGTDHHKRYARLKNLCTRRVACYTIVVPGRPDPRGKLARGVTKDVRYGTDQQPRALYVKNRAC